MIITLYVPRKDSTRKTYIKDLCLNTNYMGRKPSITETILAPIKIIST